jgi:opacity protein-like surface antigen
MHPKKTLLAALLVAAPFSAMAASPGPVGNLDVYYIDAEAEATSGGLSGSVDGDGFGVRGAGKFNDQAFIFGEYQQNDYDDSDNLEIRQIRAGVGFLLSSSEQADLYVKGSFLNFESETDTLGSGDDNGWAIHGGAAFKAAPGFTLFGEIGYLDVGDTDGPEYNIGAAFNVTDQLGLVANYRYTDLDVDGGDTLELKDLQLGVRFNF